MGKGIKAIWNEWKGELFLTALFLPLFWWLMDSGYLNDSTWVSQKAAMALLLVGIAALVLVLCKKMTWERAVLLLLLCGLILRMSYALGTHSYIRHHDYGDIDWFVYGFSDNLGVNDYGHAPYILYLYLNRQLADFNVGQFYHPPLFHALAAICMWMTYKILRIEDLIYLFEASKIVSCLASCYTLLLVPKICRELNIRRTGKCMVVGIMAFLPMFYLMAAWVNNDGLVLFFMTWIVLYTIRWNRDQSWGNTLMLALGFGFGMMSKVSCGLLALFTGLFMLMRLYQAIRKNELKALIPKYIGFAIVSFPLGLAYPLRNFLKFGQAFNYVLELNITKVPVRGFVQRFLTFPVSRLFSPVFADAEEYNLNLFLLKTASFGEFSYEKALEPWGIAIIGANLVLILLAMVGVVVVWRREKTLFWRWAALYIWGVMYVSAIVFSWEYPYTCSMDARYLSVTVLFGALYLGKAGQWSKWLYNVLSFLALIVLAVSGGYFFLHV